MKRRVIIDLDAGTDDAYALMFLLSEHKKGNIQLEAITCCEGNTTVDNVATNVIRILEITQLLEIPVYKGPGDVLIGPKFPSVHGEDGFGDLVHEKQPDMSKLQKENAIIALNRIVSSNPKEISLLFVGPLTNLALVLKVFPDFKDNVKDLSIMGGNYTAFGNVTSTAEFNFLCDPEAAFIVLESLKCPILVMPLETCHESALTEEFRLQVLGKIDNDFMKLMNRAEANIWTEYEGKGWFVCDAYLAASFLYPEIILNKTSHHVTVEMTGNKTRGQAVLDHTKKNPPNAEIIEKINLNMYTKLIQEAVEYIL